MMFGSRVSASRWGSFGYAIKVMTSLRPVLVSWYDDCLKMIKFKYPAPTKTILVQAPKCDLNLGVLDKQGSAV